MNYNHWLLFFLVSFIYSCGDDFELPTVDPAEQFRIDVGLIKDYLKTNGLESMAQETESGLHYIIDDLGTVRSITEFDQVNVLLKGYYLDGSVFDETDECSPVTVNLDRVIPGVREGLLLFNVGGKGHLYLPSVLGFGQIENQVIPPNSVLAFDFEIVDQMQFDQAKINDYLVSTEIVSYLSENNYEIDKTLSGIHYWLEAVGNGDSPKSTSTVTVYYKGYYSNGTTFDEAIIVPTTFKLNEVIRGWQEVLQLMKPGGKGTFLIPSDLAYGPEGRDPIPGNTMLVFDIELVEFTD